MAGNILDRIGVCADSIKPAAWCLHPHPTDQPHTISLEHRQHLVEVADRMPPILVSRRAELRPQISALDFGEDVIEQVTLGPQGAGIKGLLQP